MEKDKSGSIKSILGMIIGIGGYWLLTNILFGSPDQQFALTNVQLIGYPIVLIITIIGTIVAFRMSFKSKLVEFGMIYVIVMVPILLLVLLMFMNKWYGTPVLQLATMQTYILAAIIFYYFLLVKYMFLAGWVFLY